MPDSRHTLSKEEKVCGKMRISRLMHRGKYSTESFLRYCYMPSEAPVSAILASVPKRHFKRAVKRNLLKRRIREAYRLQKETLRVSVDIMFVYQDEAVRSFGEIFETVGAVLRRIADETSA